ncbi:MAG TPA: proline dehydrogenase family protein [Candidatus Dormibacteraeota bacterium]|nr:proline dehydrogenase family protein [Candidatus Dormibacteraeota bacterium]
MGMLKAILLKGSESRRLRSRAMHYRFVRRAVRRFMPGERLEDALEAARNLRDRGIETILTYLGENLSSRSQAHAVVDQYLEALRRASALNLPAVVSVKLTELGLDLDREFCFDNLCRIIDASPSDEIVWIDMESSSYVDATLDVYRRARAIHPNVGVCLQSYLYRTAGDLDGLLPFGPAIRLVKGAYGEPAELAMAKKSDVDQNFFRLAETMLGEEAQRFGMRAVIATHDVELIRRVQNLARVRGLPQQSFAFHMLYGVQRGEQMRLAREGWRVGVLVSYGKDWFAWYMRRLAERPANLLFLLTHLIG